MRKRILEMMLGITLSTVLLSGCGNSYKDYAGETIYGQVSEVSKDSRRLLEEFM